MTSSQQDSVQATDFTEVFDIARWHAWAPGVQNPDDWHAWLQGTLVAPPDAQPDVSFLPGLLRRRLDRQGRMALHTAWPCAKGLEAVPLVYASRHGALQRTLEMLVALTKDEPLSPTLFSLAVHNSTAGLFSIARGDRSATTAMAAGKDSLTMGLLEAAGMLADGAAHVLVMYADDVAPPPYTGQVGDPPALPFAISLLLTAQTDRNNGCRLGLASGSAPGQTPETALIEFLVENRQQVVMGSGQAWRLERVDAG